MAVEWTITIRGRNEFGDICLKEVRIDKSSGRLSDGEIGLFDRRGQEDHDGVQSAVVEP